MRHLFLCSQPRTGSNLFLHLLNAAAGTYAFKTLSEAIFNPGVIYYQRIHQDLRDILEGDVTRFCVAGACKPEQNFDLEQFKNVLHRFHDQFGQTSPISVKWFPMGMEQFIKVVGSKGLELNKEGLELLFGEITWVWLRREDWFNQFISHYLARKSQKWEVLSQSEASLLPEEAPYDFEEMYAMYTKLRPQNEYWPNKFIEWGVEPHCQLVYEDLAENYEVELQRFSKETGLPVDIPAASQVLMQRQASQINEDYKQRFMEELAQYEKRLKMEVET